METRNGCACLHKTNDRNKFILGFLLQSKHWGQGESQSIQTCLRAGIFMKKKYSVCNDIHIEWMQFAYITPAGMSLMMMMLQHE